MLCEFYSATFKAQFGLGSSAKSGFLTRCLKLESEMFEKAGGRDLLKYLCINLAISSSSDYCIVSRLCC